MKLDEGIPIFEDTKIDPNTIYFVNGAEIKLTQHFTKEEQYKGISIKDSERASEQEK